MQPPVASGDQLAEEVPDPDRGHVLGNPVGVGDLEDPGEGTAIMGSSKTATATATATTAMTAATTTTTCWKPLVAAATLLVLLTAAVLAAWRSGWAAGRAATQAQVYGLGGKLLATPAGPPAAPAYGLGGKLLATRAGPPCTTDYYHPSQLELAFHSHALDWTWPPQLCSSLGGAADEWIGQNQAGGVAGPLFSRICRRGQPEKVIEPLAGILRDPRVVCNAAVSIMSREWLVLDDDHKQSHEPAPKRYFFDAGGTRFGDQLANFVTAYQRRGLLFDEVFVWEASRQAPEAYWLGVPDDVRAFWEPRVHFYNGVPVGASTPDCDNPLDRIKMKCRTEDFCVFKLDIDTPFVELPIVKQLLNNRSGVADLVDEFFFEHHVHGIMQRYGWGGAVNGTFADSYDIFSKLRQLGIRAHSWI